MPQYFSDATGARTQAPYIKSVMLYLLSYGIDPDYYYFEILTSVIKKIVGRGGFEPPKPKHLIYSQAHLTALEPSHNALEHHHVS